MRSPLEFNFADWRQKTLTAARAALSTRSEEQPSSSAESSSENPARRRSTNDRRSAGLSSRTVRNSAGRKEGVPLSLLKPHASSLSRFLNAAATPYRRITSSLSMSGFQALIASKVA